MVQYDEQMKNQYTYTSSDLVNFLGCHHATFLDIKSLTDKKLSQYLKTSKSNDSIKHLSQKKAFKYKNSYLQKLKSTGKTITQIPIDLSLKKRNDLTIEAIEAGKEMIYHAVLLKKPWCATVDFLIKTQEPSSLGNYSYEAHNIKLGHVAKPEYILQLCTASYLLEEQQAQQPKYMHLTLGDGQLQSFKTSDFFHYYLYSKNRFEDHVQNLPTVSDPEPCQHCDLCVWKEHCLQQWEKNNHLKLVANIQRSQIKKLHKANIYTVEQLSATTQNHGLNPDTFTRLQSQAKLQTYKAQTNKDKYEIIPYGEGKGLERIPLPNEGDLFFDIEGDPFYPKALEYLLGLYVYKDDSFKTFWGHSHKEEKESFLKFMAFLENHFKKYPNAYLYHYNHYETTALKRLACRYAACEEQLDNLLRGQKFIDLYLVVCEGIRTSQPGYSLKDLEVFFMKKRDNSVTTAIDSILTYHQWQELREDKLLKDIADYNKQDCISIYLLRDWLLNLKTNHSPVKDPIGEEIQAERERKDWEIRYEEYQEALNIHKNPSEKNKHTSYLLEFHNRENKPQWWSLFDRQDKFENELIEDPECIGGLQQIDDPYKEKHRSASIYKFPPQDYKLKKGNDVVNTSDIQSKGFIIDLDDNNCTVTIQYKGNFPTRLSIGPSGPMNIKIKTLRDAIYRYADQVIRKKDHHHIATKLLTHAIPKIKGKTEGQPIVSSTDLQTDILKAVTNLDHSYLFIQGPPGTGKTYTSSYIIVDLIKKGKKVGIASNSHKAIHNLLRSIEKAAIEKGVRFRGIKKATNNKEESYFKNSDFIDNETNTRNISMGYDLYAGTAWLFSHLYFDNSLDYLFIDEAGQVSIANVVAMAGCCKNLILVGDQMQLGQPIQGTHPGKAGLSVLEFLLGENATVPKERGVLLDKTYRCGPKICQFISDAFYDGRLTAHKNTLQQKLDLRSSSLPNEGIVMLEVHHENCRQKSEEEGQIIKDKYNELLGQTFYDKNGQRISITQDDILVISPYNVQVNYLSSLLPEGAKVGTIDKFQGQEAPIVLISMVTSSVEDLPRHIEFLYSRNRLNVAISRAQCLAVIVINPKLLEAPCKNIQQMKLVNTFCLLNDYAVKYKHQNTFIQIK